MDYATEITQHIKKMMRSKTKLFETDVIKYIEKLAIKENPTSDKSTISRYAFGLWTEYLSENTDYKHLDGDIMYYIFDSPSDVCIFKNGYNNFIQRQKIKKDSKGSFIIVINGFGKPEKLYGI